MEIVKCTLPKKCCICGEWDGWKNPTIDSIETWDYDSNYTSDHHHKACVADAICNPEDYHISIVKVAMRIFKKINTIEDEELKERVNYRQKLAKAQDELCKQGG